MSILTKEETTLSSSTWRGRLLRVDYRKALYPLLTVNELLMRLLLRWRVPMTEASYTATYLLIFAKYSGTWDGLQAGKSGASST
jgi:hypothetical protein